MAIFQLKAPLTKAQLFIFNLPLKLDESRAPANKSNLLNINALIVDDNPCNLNILKSMLEHWGINVTEASSAQSALDTLSSNWKNDITFDILISDHMMPDMSGHELINKVKTLEFSNKHEMHHSFIFRLQ